MKKFLLRALLALAVLIFGLVAFIFASWEKKYDAPYPDITASKDSAVIARGKYLIFGPAHCVTCHVPMDKIADAENGIEMPLSGGWTLPIDPGIFRAPNLTPDMETGLGSWKDNEIARALRYMVNKDGHTMFPFMPFQELSDDDLTAIISYLRTQAPVNHKVERSELNFLGKALSAFGVVKPEGPKNTPPKSVAIGPTVEYGSYLANSVANCRGCHTERDLKTGAFTGVDFAGGFMMPPDAFSKGYSFVTPNLTPDAETGVMTDWSESTFVSRMKKGRVVETTPMPWGCFSTMDTTDLKALYQYLHSLKPTSNKIVQTVYAPGQKLPE